MHHVILVRVVHALEGISLKRPLASCGKTLPPFCDRQGIEISGDNEQPYRMLKKATFLPAQPPRAKARLVPGEAAAIEGPSVTFLPSRPEPAETGSVPMAVR